MKKRVFRVLLCCLCAAALFPSALAADSAASGDTTVKYLGLTAVEKAVKENNTTVQALRKTAASMDTGSSLSAGYDAQGSGLEAQIESYQALIDSLEKTMEDLDAGTDLYKTYEAQKKLLENSLAGLQSSLDSLPSSAQIAVAQIEDVAYQLRKQADNLENQLAMSAQTMLLSIQTLKNSEQALQNQIELADEQLAVKETQFSLGIISAYDLEQAQHERESLSRSLETLQNQYETMANNLALLCGYSGDTLVMPATLTQVQSRDIRSMSYEKDLEEALSNSYSIWEKRNDLRSAQNDYDEDISGTAEAVQAAKQALSNEQESVKASFQTTYQNVLDCWQALSAAQTAEEQAERDYQTAQTKHSCGMISDLELKQAEYDVESAKLSIQTAQNDLTSAYKQYEWAKRGLTVA